jgi:hypothetical protein
MNVMSLAPVKKAIELQRAIERIPHHLVRADFPLLHHFSKGVYARSLLIPAGHVIVGHRHATEHLLIMSVGDVDITTDEGMQHLVGFNVINTKPGIKRAIYAHADTILTTIHVTDENDPDIIGAHILMPEPQEAIEGDTP